MKYLYRSKEYLDVLQANPTWYNSGKQRSSSFLTVLISLAVVGVSFYLKWNYIQHLWVDVQQLVSMKSSKSALGYNVEKLTLGLSFEKLSHYPGGFHPDIDLMAYYMSAEMSPLGRNVTRLKVCPEHFRGKAELCIQIENSDYLMTSPVPRFQISPAYELTVAITIWWENVNHTTLAKDQIAEVVSWTIYKNDSCCEIEHATIIETVIYNSLNVNQPPQIRYSVQPDRYRIISMCLPGVTTLMDRSVYGSAVVNSMMYVRHDITVIIGAVLSQIQLFVTLLAVGLLNLSVFRSTLRFMSGVYEHQLFKNMNVDVLFLAKYSLWKLCALFSLNRWLRKKGIFQQQRVFDCASRSEKALLSIENLLNRIENIKNVTVSPEKAPSCHGKSTRSIFYPKTDYFSDQSINQRIPSIFNLQKERKPRYLNWLKSFDLAPCPIEFNCKPQHRTSYFSIFIVLMGIALMLVIAFLLNMFNIDQQTTFSNKFYPGYNFTGKGIVLKLMNSYTLETANNSIADRYYKVDFDYINNVEQVVGHPKVGREAECDDIQPNLLIISGSVNYCLLNMTIEAYPVKNMRIRITKLAPGLDSVSWVLLQPQYYINYSDPDQAFTMLRLPTGIPMGARIHFVATVGRNSHGRTESGIEVFGVPHLALNQGEMIFSVTNEIMTQTKFVPTIWDLITNAFNINMICFVFLAQYIAKPYNAKQAQSSLKQLYFDQPQTDQQTSAGDTRPLDFVRLFRRLYQRQCHSVKDKNDMQYSKKPLVFMQLHKGRQEKYKQRVSNHDSSAIRIKGVKVKVLESVIKRIK